MKTNKKKYVLHFILDLVAVGILIGLDQFTKSIAVARLKNQAPYDIIPGVLQFSYLENRGAAFGMLQNQKWFFIIVGSLFLIVITIALFKLPLKRKYTALRVCFVLLVSGAVGNMIDRIMLDYVIDFIYVVYINFPIFNIADCYVTVATTLFVILILFFYKEEDLDFKKAKQVRIHSSMREREENHDTDSNGGK